MGLIQTVPLFSPIPLFARSCCQNFLEEILSQDETFCISRIITLPKKKKSEFFLVALCDLYSSVVTLSGKVSIVIILAARKFSPVCHFDISYLRSYM